jgi:Subtilase family
LIVRHEQQPAVLGVDPRLVLVFETNALIDPQDFGPAGLRVLDAATDQAVVAFADDPQLAGFLDRLERYRQGLIDDRRSAAFEPFFDAIESVRRYGPQDRLTGRLESALASRPIDELILIDVECWFPETRQEAQTWMDSVIRAVQTGNGQVLDRYLNPAAGLSLLRVKTDVSLVRQLGELDLISRLDLLPEPPFYVRDTYDLGLTALPTFPNPRSTAPLVGVIDSGVRSAHPLLAGAVVDATTVSAAFSDGEDRFGHGTAVAALLLYGSIEPVLQDNVAPAPLCRLLSVRVLDDDNCFPQGVLWAREVDEAIRYCADQGARIINLSIGDPGTPYRGPRSTPVAAIIDQLARELGLVIIVPTGNIFPIQYTSFDASLPNTYPDRLLASPHAGLLDPGPAALALTVGATVGKEMTESVNRRAIGHIGWPSPISRPGPGIGDAIKPEVVAPGGTFAYDVGAGDVVKDDELASLTADGSGPGRLLTAQIGTSLAVPLVSRIAAAVQERYPAFGPNLIRALVLQAADDRTPSFLSEDEVNGRQSRLFRVRRLIGYGQARLDQAVSSDDRRVVLFAEDAITVNDVHLYEIPIPTSFFVPGGVRGVTISLCFDPDTRAHRLDYLSSRMKFELIRGVPPEEIVTLFVQSPEDENGERDEVIGEQEDEESDETPDGGPRINLTDLRSWERPKLEPSARRRSAGANQLGRIRFYRKLNELHGTSFLLVVQNTNRWAPEGSSQDYAVAVTLWRSDNEPELYAELAAELQARAEVELRAETELRG